MSIPHKRSVMTLFCDKSHMHSHRVRLVIAEKGLTCEYHFVDKDNPPEALSNYNPYREVPTLLDRDLVLYTSEIIMEYLEERFPHPPLMPVYPIARANIRLMMYHIKEDWVYLSEKILSEGDKKGDLAKQLQESILSIAKSFDENPFFMSEEFTLADCCLGPLFWRLPSLGVEIPKQIKGFHAYCQKIFARESFQSSLTDEERALR